MFPAFLSTILSLWFYVCTSAAHSPPWTDSRTPSPAHPEQEGVRDLDPAACAARCRDKGYQVAVLSSRSCYCGNQLNGSMVFECFNTSSNESTMDEKGGSETQRSLSLFRGNLQEGTVETKDTFLENINVFAFPEPGRTFVLENSGNLADCPDQPTVRIHAEQQTYPSNTDITLQAVANLFNPVEFLWHFGDSTSTFRTNSTTVTKKYYSPGRFDVALEASDGRTSVTSDVFPLLVQKVVHLNRLVHQASVLQNHTVTVSCRVNTGSNLSFLWSFGDETTRLGQRAVDHVYHRSGEYTIKVIAFNLVSSASLSSHIFVVERHCQPPPVKLMGPAKLLVRKNEIIHLGVTFDSEVDCESSQGLHYTWNIFDSTGQIFPLPRTNIHRQDLIVQSHLLEYGTYTAIAKVQVISSVVYSNYSVKLEVMQIPPIALIKGGTNIFISKRSSTLITLDGLGSYDVDFPSKPLTYSWTCKPVSSITSSCFNHPVPASLPVLQFPVMDLKANFDQFQFKLTVHNGNISSSSETFLTVMKNIDGKVLIYCNECQGEQINWNQPFSVRASCEGCAIPVKHIQYIWSWHLVNASSKPIIDEATCYTVDLGVPSTITENLTSSTETLISYPHSTNISVLQHDQTISGSLVAEDDDGISDCKTSLKKSRDTSFKADLSQSEGPPKLLNLDKERNVLLDYFDAINEFPSHHDTSVDWEVLDSVVEGRLEEGNLGMSAGRFQDADFEALPSGDFPTFDASLIEDMSSNLVDPQPMVKIREPTLLDLPRDTVARSLLESYISTGISSNVIRFKPFSLRPNSRYMLEVTAQSQSGVLGRAQLFLKTNPAPEGVSCQVQPVKGKELHTHFSIFCTSGREDLLYKYSYSVGGRPPRILYEGADFQYYFSLPSGDPNDNYKVTIYTEIRSRTHGSSSKPCPVTVQVEPIFFRETPPPSQTYQDWILCDSALKNVSALLTIGNTLEIHNYISLLSIILNRLGEDTQSNTHAQHTHMRNVLIGIICKLEAVDQETLMDSIVLLKDLLLIKNQVSFVSVKQVTAHVQIISDRFNDSTLHSGLMMNQTMLSSLIDLLSSSLLAVTCADEDSPKGCTDVHASLRGFSLLKRTELLVGEILETAAQLMLKFILLEEIKEHTVTTGFISLKAASQNQTLRVVRGGNSTFYIPVSLMAFLNAKHRVETEQRQQEPCFLTVLTEFTHNYHTWATSPLHQLSGPVVELNFYKCRTRRKISVRSLIEPIDVEIKLPQRNMSSNSNHRLLNGKINIHSFNITQEHLHQSIQMTIMFNTPCSGRTFPIMLLFSMFERPTPRMHHLYKIHRWKSNVAHITLLPSSLSVAGIGHLALLYADFNQTSKRKRLREEGSYGVTVESSVCVSWDSQRRTWTPHGCRTLQEDTTSTLNCRCHQLRPLTVIQQQLKSSDDIIDVDPLLSASSCDVTILGVLLVIVLLYILGMRMCKRADDTSERNQRVHYLPDNSPSDPVLYLITVHTGLWSAANMSAKVYIVLYGEDGSSQTKELQAPGYTLFRRNSQDTFILSTGDNLGALSGLHIWHDNSGPSPEWYIKHVEVTEISREDERRPVRLLVGHCWLAVNKGNGRVDRMLRVCTQRLSFTKMLSLKLLDYLADLHLWACVCCYHRPSSFTHCQRLSVCVLLLLGYACVNTVIISQMEDQIKGDIIDVSSLSVTTGLLAVVSVLPVATAISLLFRMCGFKSIKSKRPTEETDCFLSVHSVDDNMLGTYYGNGLTREDTDVASTCTRTPVNTDKVKERGNLHTDVLFRSQDIPVLAKILMVSKETSADAASQRHKYGLSPPSSRLERLFSSDTMHDDAEGEKLRRIKPRIGLYLTWTVFLLLSFSCLLISAVLGTRFSSSNVVLWIHSLLISLICCIFLIQPAVVFIMAVLVCCWYLKTSDMYSFFRIKELNQWNQDAEDDLHPRFSKTRCSYFEKMLAARQRTRFLRLVRPMASAELKNARGKRRKEVIIQKTLQNFSLCVSMLFLMMCIAFSSSLDNHYHLNTAIRRQFTRSHNNAFTLIQTHREWWKWTKTTLLDLLYKNSTINSEMSSILIGEPVLQKTEKSVTLQCLVSMATLGCYSGSSTTVSLGRTRYEATSKLGRLQSEGWRSGQTMALGFTLYSPSLNLYTSVTLLAELSYTGVTSPSSKVQSVRIRPPPTTGGYTIMALQLVFLLFSLLLLCQQASCVMLQGLASYWRTRSNWIEVSLLSVTLLYYDYYIYRSALIVEVERHNYTDHVDISTLTACEQFLQTLCGILLFLLTIKCVIVLRRSRTFAVPVKLFSVSLSKLTRPVISVVILQVALSSCGNVPYPISFKSNLYWCLKTVRSHIIAGEIYGVFSLSSFLVCTVMATAVVFSTYKRVKQSQRQKNVFTAAEMVSSIKVKVSEVTGRRRWTDNHKERHWCQLEEFESAVEELLFRLNALTDSLHHTLPPKAHIHSPVFSALPELHHVNSQDFVTSHMLNDCTFISNNQREIQDFSPRFRSKQGHKSHLSSDTKEEISERLWMDNIQQWVNTDHTSPFKTMKPMGAKRLVNVLVHDEPQSVNP